MLFGFQAADCQINKRKRALLTIACEGIKPSRYRRGARAGRVAE